MDGRSETLIQKVALSMIPGVNAELVRNLMERGITCRDFFTTDFSDERFGTDCALRRAAGIDSMHRDEALFRAGKEVEFMERHNIRAYSLYDDDYPMLLREIPDAPVVLYKIGNADLDAEKLVSIVGTRRPTNYGCDFCSGLVDDIGSYFPETVIVSGLAYGIDSVSHSSALEKGLPTVAVVAHGLDTVYPAAHRDLAGRIVRSGGAIVSEYPSGTRIFQGNFLKRNRIVAGLSHVTVVVESEIRGGAMSTANTAFNYSRDVMALPGRISDRMSEGCNLLIRKNKAGMITTAADMIEQMNWKPLGVPGSVPLQRNLFPELGGNEAKVYELLRKHSEPLTVDAIFQATNIHISELMAILTELEFDAIITKLPGSRYTLA